jgi:hypothetical protein
MRNSENEFVLFSYFTARQIINIMLDIILCGVRDPTQLGSLEGVSFNHWANILFTH